MQAKAVYDLKPGAGKLFRQSVLYTREQIDQIKEAGASNLPFFDFVVNEKRERYETQWFDFNNRQVEKKTYKDHNNETIKA